MIATRRLAVLAAVATLAINLAGCGEKDQQQQAATAKDTGGDHHGHHHVAPHGGLLVPVGDHTANLEFVLDTTSGRLTAYVLDGCAENPLRIAQTAIKLTVVLPPVANEPAGRALMVDLDAVANPLTGETVGDTAEFGAVVPELAGAVAFAAVVGDLEIRGTQLTGVDFTYPTGAAMDGSDHEHGHEHGHDHDH